MGGAPSHLETPPSYSEWSYANEVRSGNRSESFLCIGDQYDNLEEVTQALRAAGLESSNLILGIDFTKSNEWTGKNSFNGQSLHAISSGTLNPYEQATSIIGRTLSQFDDDDLIPCFGFGDVSTHDHSVFSFYPDFRACRGFEEALRRYREIVPHLRLAGPTSFAPVIKTAIDIVEQSGGQYHILLIIADGQVNTAGDRLSSQEKSTINAIVDASQYALSIVLVGVGDGPWDTMKQFDDSIPERKFDNFQFVNFTQIMSRDIPLPRKEAAFALTALMEMPSQYKATMALNILNHQSKHTSRQSVLPPPPTVLQHDNCVSKAQSRGQAISDVQLCPVCLEKPKDMAFGCGHQTCMDCGGLLITCPLCRQTITSRLRLY